MLMYVFCLYHFGGKCIFKTCILSNWDLCQTHYIWCLLTFICMLLKTLPGSIITICLPNDITNVKCSYVLFVPIVLCCVWSIFTAIIKGVVRYEPVENMVSSEQSIYRLIWQVFYSLLLGVLYNIYIYMAHTHIYLCVCHICIYMCVCVCISQNVLVCKGL